MVRSSLTNCRSRTSRMILSNLHPWARARGFQGGTAQERGTTRNGCRVHPAYSLDHKPFSNCQLSAQSPTPETSVISPKSRIEPVEVFHAFTEDRTASSSGIPACFAVRKTPQDYTEDRLSTFLLTETNCVPCRCFTTPHPFRNTKAVRAEAPEDPHHAHEAQVPALSRL